MSFFGTSAESFVITSVHMFFFCYQATAECTRAMATGAGTKHLQGTDQKKISLDAIVFPISQWQSKSNLLRFQVSSSSVPHPVSPFLFAAFCLCGLCSELLSWIKWTSKKSTNDFFCHGFRGSANSASVSVEISREESKKYWAIGYRIRTRLSQTWTVGMLFKVTFCSWNRETREFEFEVCIHSFNIFPINSFHSFWISPCESFGKIHLQTQTLKK